jgi:hypothetical protein
MRVPDPKTVRREISDASFLLACAGVFWKYGSWIEVSDLMKHWLAGCDWLLNRKIPCYRKRGRYH